MTANTLPTHPSSTALLATPCTICTSTTTTASSQLSGIDWEAATESQTRSCSDAIPSLLRMSGTDKLKRWRRYKRKLRARMTDNTRGRPVESARRCSRGTYQTKRRSNADRQNDHRYNSILRMIPPSVSYKQCHAPFMHDAQHERVVWQTGRSGTRKGACSYPTKTSRTYAVLAAAEDVGNGCHRREKRQRQAERIGS